MAISIDPNYIRVRAGIPDPVAMQMDFLQKLLSSPNAPQESIQHFYYTTILFCIDDNKEESAFKLLSQAKQGGIFNEQPGLRASLYSSAISKLVEKDFMIKRMNCIRKL